ncbi:MAG TPA: aminotransferase class V-fold PLP-dependent enzyme [Marmoricola sp.]|nr:aminotransferase class V-fold PLP-dependent enzyme [Marmoricola sp.]
MEGPGSSYLDTASAEPLHPAAYDVLQRALEQGYADPRRLHGPARNARLLLDNARAVVAECLGVRIDEVTFTPTGTHAVHLGVLGLLAGAARSGDRLLASAVEHSSVLHAGRWHAARGGRSDTVPVEATGRVALDALAEALGAAPASARAAGAGAAGAGAAVLALQAANHEVGTLQPVAQAAELADAVGTVLFVDACASGGRLDLPPGWAAAALSAHKWGGPAGVGVLLVRKGARWRQPFPGDDRVDERATGMENVPAALAAAAALQAVVAEREQVNARQHRLVARIRAAVAQIPDTEVVGDPEARLPHLMTFSCLYVDGEALVTELARHGFAVASGSACTASTLEPSHVLAAMGALTHGNVRVSLGRDTTEADVDRLLAVLPTTVDALRQRIGAP